MKIVLLTGHRKSGTTLLSKLIDGHPELMSYPTDLSVLYAVFPKYTQMWKNQRVQLNRRFRKVIYQTLRDSGISFGAQGSARRYAETIYSHMSLMPESEKNDPGKILMRLVRGWLDARRIRNESCTTKIFLKETSQLVYLPGLRKVCRDLKVIVLIRDPRDNFAAIYAGMKKHYGKFGETDNSALASTVNRLKFDLSLATYYRQIKPPWMFFCKFENLVCRPEVEMKKICRFIGISFNLGLLQPTVEGLSATGNNYEGKKFRGIFSGHVAKYRSRLPDFHIKILEWFLEKEMKEWGYLPKSFQIAPRHLQAIDQFYRWYNSHYFYKDSFR